MEVACPAEDFVRTLLNSLVDPLLPLRSYSKGRPSEENQKLVAKQVHAVVLLYNYYHKKNHPHLETLNFDSFCKLVGVLRPNLVAHMKLMQGSVVPTADDIGNGNKSSLLEEAIMDACDICTSLNPSEDLPRIEGWPVSKVAVLLVDSKKKNLYLQFGTITEGVWSLIEKCIDTTAATAVGLEEIAFSAVNEELGINKSDIFIMESHIVYSTSEEKTATRLYIMQSTLKKYDDLFEVLINDVIDSLQGPLIQKISSNWELTSVVEYFHLLPFAGIITMSFPRYESDADQQKENFEPECLKLNVKRSRTTELSSEPALPSNNSLSGSGSMDVFDRSTPDIGARDIKSEKSKKRKKVPGVEVDSKAKRKVGEVDVSSRMIKGMVKYGSQDVNNTIALHNNIPAQHGDLVGSRVHITSQSDRINNDQLAIVTPKETASKGINNDQLAIVISKETASKGINNDQLHASIASQENTNAIVAFKETASLQTASKAIKSNQPQATIAPKKTTSKAINCDQRHATIASKEIASKVINNDQIHATIASKETAHAIVASKETAPKAINIDQQHAIVASKETASKAISIDQQHAIISLKETAQAIVASKETASEAINSDQLHAIIASKETALSRIAMKAIRSKRDKLTLLQREIEDEILLCDKHILAISNRGVENLEIILESIIEYCNDGCVRGATQEMTSRHSSRSHGFNKNKLQESACSLQRLDNICSEHNWALPTYLISVSDGEYQAEVSINGGESRSTGDKKHSPGEARESAASYMLAKFTSV